jgi:hypothetical protein
MKFPLNKKYIILLVLGSLAATSCKKTLDLSPTDTINAADAFTTVSDIEAGTVGAYAALSYENSYYIGSVMADEVRWTPDNNGRNYGLIHKWNFASDDGDAARAWDNLWVVIDRTNRALEAIDNIPANTPAEVATKDKDKGELLALRAFSHFELYRWYSQSYEPDALSIPYVTQSGIFNKPSRLTVAEVLTNVKSDLTQAKTLVPTTSTDIFRISLPAISALEARIALYEKNWNDAITYSKEAIAAKPLSTIDQFPGIWKDANTNEQIFDLKRNNPSNYTGLLWRDTNGDTFFSPSNKLIKTYDQVNDIRYNSYISTDLTIAAPKEQVQVIKFSGQTGTIKYNNAKVFRTGEMYLILAEAYAQSSATDLVSAALALNTLRANRIKNYVPVAYTSKDALINDIMLERFKELPFEGHRYFDLRRQGADIVRDPSDVTQSVGIPLTLPSTNYRYILPIEQNEIFANPNITQNKGYN